MADDGRTAATEFNGRIREPDPVFLSTPTVRWTDASVAARRARSDTMRDTAASLDAGASDRAQRRVCGCCGPSVERSLLACVIL